MLLLVIVIVIAQPSRMSKIHFDHEKLRAYQDALSFVVFADSILAEIPTKPAARDQLDLHRADQGKLILVGVVSMLVGLLETFGGQFQEEPGLYLETSNHLTGLK